MEPQNQSNEDALTGCKIFRDRSEEAWKTLRARFSGDFCVLYVDIDDLKIINDQFGIRFGEQTLSGIAGAMSEVLPERGEIYRFGGDEFLVLLPHCTRDQAIAIAETMRRKARLVQVYNDHPKEMLPSPGATFGVACAVGNDWDLMQLIARADEAMQAGKERGKNQVSS